MHQYGFFFASFELVNKNLKDKYDFDTFLT